MGVTPVSGTMRLAMGFGLMAVVLWMGFEQRALWCLPILGVAFTASFVTGKLRAWRVAAQQGKTGSALAGLPLTFVIQMVLVGLTYLVGFGVGAIYRRGVDIQPFGLLDWALPIGAGLLGAVTGIVIDRLEGKPDTVLPTWAGGEKVLLHPDENGETDEAGTPDLEVLAGPVTPQSFYAGIHYSHGTYDHSVAGASTYDGSPNEKSMGRTGAQMAEQEARLGRTLPGGLKALYAVQNGGSVNQVCWPKTGAIGPAHFKNVIMPFSGYNDLYPVELIRTVYDSVTDYADPDSDRDDFPDGCLNMLILAQWYRETLFLDYTQPGEPRIGFVDFDTNADGGWASACQWWPDFETFFSSLRHYKDV